MEVTNPSPQPDQPAHDPPPAPLRPSPGIPEPAPQPSPGEPEPGPRPAHDPPLPPEHDRSGRQPFIPQSWTPDLPLDEVVYDENRVPG